MTYTEALAYIASLEPRGWRLGLDRMAEFVRRAGLSAAVAGGSPRYVHVAGTNGKGSTTAYLQSLMVECGSKTGAFYSPFVVNPRERVQLGRSLISELEMARLTDRLREVAEQMEGTEFSGITEFEFKTALGFLAWHEAGCEWVALETGLGGRLDATNVVTPAASVIVSIGLDHQAILGNTVGEIAREKAGIIKPGIPLVLGEVPAEAEAVITAVAEENGSSVWKYGRDVRWLPETGSVETPHGRVSGLQPSLRGVWQGHNLSLAIAGLQAAGLGDSLTQPVAQRGAEAAYVPGRFERLEYMGREIVFDGAHNGDSARALAQTLTSYLKPGARVVLITNMLLGHEPAEFYGPLLPHIRAAVVCPIDFHRARPTSEMAEALSAMGIGAEAVAGPSEALAAAAAVVAPEDIILVTGSFYLVGDVQRALAHA